MGNTTKYVHQLGKTTKEARIAAAQIIDDPIYRATLLARARAGTLHAAIEQMLWYYRFGKPQEKIEIDVPQQDMSSLSTEELAARAQQIAEDLRVAKEIATSVTEQIQPADDSSSPTSTEDAKIH